MVWASSARPGFMVHMVKMDFSSKKCSGFLDTKQTKYIEIPGREVFAKTIKCITHVSGGLVLGWDLMARMKRSTQ